MRLTKMIGLAAMAAVAAMAFVGVSSASANKQTGVCKENSLGLECPSAQLATEVHGVAVNPLLDTDEKDVLCNSSLLKASLLALGNPQVAHLESLTWTGCHLHDETECDVKTELKGLFNVLKLNTEDAHVTAVNDTTVVLVDCGFFIHCSYGGSPTLLALSSTDKAKATLHANTPVTETNDPDHASTFCPNEATWTALYESLANLYIRE